jgi:3'-phosphoadenosine 5'-phosphosulfate sulfotransferase (PAPS reductase)/FAD synthetase
VKMEKTIIQYSGGRDSTVLIHLLRHMAGMVKVVYINSGAPFPHVVEHVKQMCSNLEHDLEILGPAHDIDKYHEEQGLPVDLLPVENHRLMEKYVPLEKEDRLQSWIECCTHQMWIPMDNYLRENKIERVFLGTRFGEYRKGSEGPVYYNGSGVEHVCPLWNWTEQDIMDYHKTWKLPLADQYAYGCDSLDCWNCTAALDKHGEEKLAYMKIKYPELHARMIPRLQKIQRLLQPHMDRLQRIIED